MSDIATLKQHIHTLLGWNMQPLSTAEILASGDALHCPACKKLRYVMFKAATADTPMVYAGQYCSCGEISQERGAATLTQENMTTFLDGLKSGRIG